MNSDDKVKLTHSLTAALDQLRVVASSTSNDPGQRRRAIEELEARAPPVLRLWSWLAFTF